MEIQASEYHLMNCASKREFKDTGWLLSDPQNTSPSLIRAVYNKKQIEIKDSSYGFYKYADWLPIKRVLKNTFPPITYKSENLAKELGLTNLYITFSGYWPKRGAYMHTCSFKETEAYSVCARLPEESFKMINGKPKKTLVVASAGNTARAFAQVCSDNNIPLVIVIPYENRSALWFKNPLNSCVKIICTPANTDYFDAIALASKLCQSEDYLEEGGAKNIARRDGMATTLLSATEFIGELPDAYFQAIGSGTGTIAAHEANLRLIEDGRFGNKIVKLYPSQNFPFAPMYEAWKAGSRALLEYDEAESRLNALKIDAKVLSNRKPPYSIAGGLYDVLVASNGDIEIINNQELEEASKLFEELEEIDIHPAAAVAVYSLKKAIEKGKVSKNDKIMLNITGGGEKLFKSQFNWLCIDPHLILDPGENVDEILKSVARI